MVEECSKPLIIRRARKEDAARIKAIHMAAVYGQCQEDYTPAQLASWTSHELEDYLRRIANFSCAFLVGQICTELAGFAAFLEGELLSLYVHPDVARRGVGSGQLTAIETHARTAQYHWLFLNSSRTAVEFYRRRGYDEIGAGEFRMDDGVEIPCIRMRKPLAVSPR